MTKKYFVPELEAIIYADSVPTTAALESNPKDGDVIEHYMSVSSVRFTLRRDNPASLWPTEISILHRYITEIESERLPLAYSDILF